MGKVKLQEGRVAEGIYFDGEVVFVTCPACGYECGEIGKHILCEGCEDETMPSIENEPNIVVDEETNTYWVTED